jgi:integron integrase
LGARLHPLGGLRHPRDLGAAEVQDFLVMLANERRVAAATHRQALSALLFLYREVLGVDMPWLRELGRPVAKRRIPVVLTHVEVQALLAQMGEGVTGLLARLLYGTGMRLLEGIRLRIKDVDFVRQVIVVRDGKGGKDRVVMLPRALDGPLRLQLREARRVWLDDQQRQQGGVYLPNALAAKYKRAAESWAWFWLFPAATVSKDPRGDAAAAAVDDDGAVALHRRHHIHEKRLQRDLHAAVRAAGIAKPATVHTLRHSFATHLAAGRHRHPHRAAAARPRRRQHDHDLHPRPAVVRRRHRQPARRPDADDDDDDTTQRQRRPRRRAIARTAPTPPRGPDLLRAPASPPSPPLLQHRPVPLHRAPSRLTPSSTAAATSAS